MVEGALLEYIKKQLRGGSSVQEVTSFLLQKGYSQHAVNDCIKHVYDNSIQVPHRWDKRWMAPTLEALMGLTKSSSKK